MRRGLADSLATRRRAGRIGFALVAAVATAAVAAAQDTPKIVFEERVAPILKDRCWKCHAGAEPQNGLNLSTRRDILRGGKSGPAIRIAAAESSLLWEKIASNQMPPEGPPLTAEEKGVLRSWINDGALAADAAAADDQPDAPGAPAAGKTEFWSFRPPQRPPAPSVRAVERVRNPVDQFVLAQLEAKSLTLSPDARRETLLRRVCYDLTGLAPTPEERQEFLADADDRAWERLIERLLANPHYGERWGRHWLDVAGYADSAGVLAEDRPLPTAFRYRDYVIRAFNADKPYDRFLQEQLAGDELSNYWGAHETLERLPDDVIEAVTATGFLRCAPDSSRPDFATIKNADALYFYPTINDTLQIVSSATLGLTVQCARCHSHKYDPIPQVEFYRLQAVFMPAFRPSQWVPQMDRQIAVATAAQKKVAAEHNGRLDAEIARLKKEQAESRERFRNRLFEERLATLPEAIRADVRQAVSQPADQRSAVAAYLAEKFQAFLRPDEAALNKLLPETYPDFKQETETRNAAIAEQERRRMHFDYIRALYDLPGPVSTPVLRRGDALTPGPSVEPGVFAALAAPEPFTWSPPGDGAPTSGRRLAFARWLTQPAHPLTARVMVNRIWLQHFGAGLVATPEDFGALGAAPSHPQLLDWLACEFVEGGWSVKHIHRLILTSSTYRQQSTFDPVAHAAAQQVDPENRLLWRQRLRRLEAEAVRDAMLHASGRLDDRMFGVPVAVARRADGEVNVADGANERRRSIYLQVLRSQPLTLLQVFDQPVMETNCTRRAQSTVSTQALTLLNSDLMATSAEQLAERVLQDSPAAPLAAAGQIVFARDWTEAEAAQLAEFLSAQQARYAALGDATELARRKAVADVCHMLLSANEGVYVD